MSDLLLHLTITLTLHSSITLALRHLDKLTAQIVDVSAPISDEIFAAQIGWFSLARSKQQNFIGPHTS
jgi:hypothetical protein